MIRSLRTQLSLAIALVVLLTVTLISLLSNALIDRQFESYINARHEVRIRDIVNNLSALSLHGGDAWDAELLHTVGMYALYDGYLIKVFDARGAVVWDAENHDMTLCRQIMREIEERMERARPGDAGGFVSREYPLTRETEHVGAVVIRYFGPYFLSESDFAFLSALNRILLAVGALSLLLAFITGWLFARRIARPVTKTAEIAKRIAAGDYGVRFAGETKTRELDGLVEAVNELSGALEEQESLRKRLTADVAHELRTPLATLSAHLEAMLEGVWEPTPERLRSCHEELARLGKLVADIERLAKVESGKLKLDKTPLDLLAFARAAGEKFELRLREKNLRLVTEGDAAEISADRDRLEQIYVNLMDNAIKYTPENGNIRVVTRDGARSAALTVEDDGAGVAAAELPLLFERFYRADKSRGRRTGGAGIGLAIVKSIAVAHGGAVEAESPPGKGCRFTVTLPK
jgi:signal transduction histidine kinase